MPSNPPPNVLQSDICAACEMHPIFTKLAHSDITHHDAMTQVATIIAHHRLARSTLQEELFKDYNDMQNAIAIKTLEDTRKNPKPAVAPMRGAEQVVVGEKALVFGIRACKRVMGDKYDPIESIAVGSLFQAAIDEAVGEYRKALERIASYRDRAYEENIVMGYPDRLWKDEDLEAIEDIARAALNPEKEGK